MSEQFNDPVCVAAFNALEHWAQDVSRDIALEIQSRCDISSPDVPETPRDFVERDNEKAQLLRQLADEADRGALFTVEHSRHDKTPDPDQPGRQK
jgi:hypothetical protein